MRVFLAGAGASAFDIGEFAEGVMLAWGFAYVRGWELVGGCPPGSNIRALQHANYGM